MDVMDGGVLRFGVVVGWRTLYQGWLHDLNHSVAALIASWSLVVVTVCVGAWTSMRLCSQPLVCVPVCCCSTCLAAAAILYNLYYKSTHCQGCL